MEAALCSDGYEGKRTNLEVNAAVSLQTLRPPSAALAQIYRGYKKTEAAFEQMKEKQQRQSFASK